MSRFGIGFGSDKHRPASGGGGGGALDYTALFSSYSAKGWCYSGGADRSSFFEDDAGVTPCSTSGVSPVGRISDLSGNGNHGINSDGMSQPVYFVSTGGFKFWMQGEVGTNRFLIPINGSTRVKASAAMTQIVAFALGAGVTGNAAMLISNYAGGWGASYHALGLSDDAPNAKAISLNNSSISWLETSATVSRSVPQIIVLNRAGTGTNQASLKVYDISGALVTSATGTQDVAGAGQNLQLGYTGGAIATQNFQFFSMCINASLSGSDEAAVIADVVSALSVG